MDSAMIAKISKAKEYAQEPERMRFRRFEVNFRGRHEAYTVTFDNGSWSCGCDYFSQRCVCSHTMALERVLGKAGLALEGTATANQ